VTRHGHKFKEPKKLYNGNKHNINLDWTINMKQLNMGCGKKIISNCINLDIKNFKGVDVVHDLDKYPYPFSNDTFDIIHSTHCLEHLTDIERALKETWRILKSGGKFVCTVPYYTSRGAFQDPTHKHFFCEDTITYYLLQYAPFSLESVKLQYMRPFKWLPFKKFFTLYLNNVVHEMTFTLVKKKQEK